MKTRFIIASIFFVGIFTLSSCEEVIEEIEEQENTENNEVDTLAVYELSLHQMYLKIEESYLQKKKDNLEEGTQEYQETQIILDSVQVNLTEIENLFDGPSTPNKLLRPNGNEVLIGLIGPIGPVGPLPGPEPLPCNCIVSLSDLLVIAPNDLQNFELRIKTIEDGEIIGGMSEPKILQSEEGLEFNAYRLDLPNNLGEKAIIEVTKRSDITQGMLTYGFMVRLPDK